MVTERIRGRIPLLPSANFLLVQMNVLATKETIPGDTIFLLPRLRADKLQRFLFDRKVSHVHSFLKSVQDPKLVLRKFALTDIFLSIVFVYPLFLVLTNQLSCQSYIKMPYKTLIKLSMHCGIFARFSREISS